MSNELKQTKGQCTFRGKIYGIENENALTVQEKFKKLKFRINTDSDNAHFVELIDFANKPKVFFRISDPNSKDNYAFVGTEYENNDLSFEELIDVFKEDMDIEELLSEKGIDLDELEQEHLIMMGTIRVKGEMDNSTRYLLPEFAIDEILNTFKDGDSVVIIAEKTVSGLDTAYNQYAIKRIFASKDEIDFENSEFAEQAEFLDEFIFNSIQKKTKEKRAVIDGFAVTYTNSTVPVSYVIDWNEYSEDEDVANYFVKNVQFGDLVKVEGVIHNRVTYGEAKQSNGVGRSTKSNRPRREIIGEKRELQIIRFDEKVGKVDKELLV